MENRVEKPTKRHALLGVIGFLMSAVGLGVFLIAFPKGDTLVGILFFILLVVGSALMMINAKSRVSYGVGYSVALLIGLAIWFYGPVAKYAYEAYARSASATQHEYDGTSSDNLKAMLTAMLGYEESEGQFPQGAGWMDAISNRLYTDDLKKGEGLKKLVYPEYVGVDGRYGYGYNASLAGKYRGEVKDPKTIVLFESAATDKNLSGDPAQLRRSGGLSITISGEIIR